MIEEVMYDVRFEVMGKERIGGRREGGLGVGEGKCGGR